MNELPQIRIRPVLGGYRYQLIDPATLKTIRELSESQADAMFSEGFVAVQVPETNLP